VRQPGFHSKHGPVLDFRQGVFPACCLRVPAAPIRQNQSALEGARASSKHLAIPPRPPSWAAGPPLGGSHSRPSADANTERAQPGSVWAVFKTAVARAFAVLAMAGRISLWKPRHFGKASAGLLHCSGLLLQAHLMHRLVRPPADTRCRQHACSVLRMVPGR